VIGSSKAIEFAENLTTLISYFSEKNIVVLNDPKHWKNNYNSRNNCDSSRYKLHSNCLIIFLKHMKLFFLQHHGDTLINLFVTLKG